LSEDFGRKVIFEKVTGHRIDIERCIGCGDCVVFCTRRVTPKIEAAPIRKRSDIWMRKALGYKATKSTAVVLGIVDGVVQVVTADMDACKECRACEDKCPTGAIELFR
jgi:NAD-dependent dihydropyrimidine dehydrogenase PreA subunit